MGKPATFETISEIQQGGGPKLSTNSREYMMAAKIGRGLAVPIKVLLSKRKVRKYVKSMCNHLGIRPNFINLAVSVLILLGG